MYLGIDIGSSSSKAAILNAKGELIAHEAVNEGTGTKGADLVLDLVFNKAGIEEAAIKFTVVTGSVSYTHLFADSTCYWHLRRWNPLYTEESHETEGVL